MKMQWWRYFWLLTHQRTSLWTTAVKKLTFKVLEASIMFSEWALITSFGSWRTCPMKNYKNKYISFIFIGTTSMSRIMEVSHRRSARRRLRAGRWCIEHYYYDHDHTARIPLRMLWFLSGYGRKDTSLRRSAPVPPCHFITGIIPWWITCGYQFPMRCASCTCCNNHIEASHMRFVSSSWQLKPQVNARQDVPVPHKLSSYHFVDDA